MQRPSIGDNVQRWVARKDRISWARFIYHWPPLDTPWDWVMKEGIHPQYFETTVHCGCSNTFTTRSTRKELKVDICNACHPFYTGKLKYVDTAGRIEKFQNKFAASGYASLNRGKKKKAADSGK